MSDAQRDLEEEAMFAELDERYQQALETLHARTGYSLSLLEEAVTYVNCSPDSLVNDKGMKHTAEEELDFLVFFFVLGLEPMRLMNWRRLLEARCVL